MAGGGLRLEGCWVDVAFGFFFQTARFLQARSVRPSKTTDMSRLLRHVRFVPRRGHGEIYEYRILVPGIIAE